MLSVCIPAHESGFPLLRRTLLNLASQTRTDFEVVVAVDGGGRFEPPSPLPYALVIVASSRPHGDIPHRNHARNAAANAASGNLLWFVDQDFLWDPWTAEHLLLAGHTPLSPVLVSIRQSPGKWLEDERWDAPGDQREMLRNLVVTGEEWAGFARRYRAGKGMIVEEHEIPEGFPLVRRDDFQPFDERFLGRGGNKESFTKRLHDYRLLASARGYHQPHWREGQPKELSEKNKAMYDAI